MPAPNDPSFTNHLAGARSPYLLQHQHNPVDWYPWGDEAFARARKEQKPIFLSVGYSTCHWCHVMAHESFENPATAKLMNAHFINIKVDREERPDVDKVYMTFVQATTGSGGWPMSVFLTPELHPFYGGTYFPPSDGPGRPGFPHLLQRVADAWQHDPAGLRSSATEAIEALRLHGEGDPGAGTAAAGDARAPQALAALPELLAKYFDEENGGFGGAPKFPRPVTLELLFRLSTPGGSRAKAAPNALRMALRTLEKMADGGIHDHLGGGFHRYSVDRFWHIPHFEKMLYDQAQLASAYLQAFQITRDPKWAEVVRDILNYVTRDLTAPEGGFQSAEDADSLVEVGKPEHREGAFYVWTAAELKEALGEKVAPVFNAVYGVKAEGNAPAGSDPHGEFRGFNTLIRRLSAHEAARSFSLPVGEAEKVLATARQALFARRSQRPRPHLDDKVITAWNGLMISAFAAAAQVLEEDAYLHAAQRAAAFLRKELWRDGHLLRSYRGGADDTRGFADDYASTIQGLLDLYAADFDTAHLAWALELQRKMDEQFWDVPGGGYFSTPAGDPTILLRLKEDYDGAEPSPNSTAALNLLRLARLTDSKVFEEKAAQIISAFSTQLARSPEALPRLLSAVAAAAGEKRQIVIAGKAGATDTLALVREARKRYAPDTIILLADGGAGQAWLGERLPFVKEMRPVENKAAAYVCENYACQAPITDVAELAKLLEGGART